MILSEEQKQAVAAIDDQVAARRRELESQITEERGSITAKDRALLDIFCEHERERLTLADKLKEKGDIESKYSGRTMKAQANAAFGMIQKASVSCMKALNQLFPPKRGAPRLETEAPEEGVSLDDY